LRRDRRRFQAKTKTKSKLTLIKQSLRLDPQALQNARNLKSLDTTFGRPDQFQY